MRIALLSVLLLAAPAARAATQTAPVPKAALTQLEAAAREAAKRGRGAEAEEIVLALRQLGFDAARATELEVACGKDAAKVSAPADAPRAAAALERAAAELAKALGPAPADPSLARLIVRLDGDAAAAQAALGRSREGERWLGDEDRANAARQARLRAVLQEAHRLEFDIETGASAHPDLANLGKECHRAAFRGIAVHGTWPEQKLARVLGEALRGLAVLHWLLTDELALPELDSLDWLLLQAPADYRAAVAAAAQRLRLDAETAAAASGVAGWLFRSGSGGFGIYRDPAEIDASALLCSRLADAQSSFPRAPDLDLWDAQPWLAAGLFHYTLLAYFRRPLGDRVVHGDPVDEEALGVGATLADAGPGGRRLRLEALARARRDPPLSALLVDQVGKVAGDLALKSMFVVESLVLQGPLAPLAAATAVPPPERTPESMARKAEAGLGLALDAFDRDWRRRFLGDDAGLAQRLLQRKPEPAPAKEAEKLAARLNELRALAFGSSEPAEVALDAGLSAACRALADELAAAPESSSAAWPPPPAWFLSGARDSAAALDTWLASFHHRHFLLARGLKRIGVALAAGGVILDPFSVAEPPLVRDFGGSERDFQTFVTRAALWPCDGRKGVPPAAALLPPSPVVAAAGTALGYPVSLHLPQLFTDADVEVELELRAGGKSGPIVDCWRAAPEFSGNDAVPLDTAWCLFPKQPLRRGAAYTVLARIRLLRPDAPALEATRTSTFQT